MIRIQTSGESTSAGCMLLFCLPFFAGGVGALVMGIPAVRAGEENAWVALLVGSVFVLFSCLVGALALQARKQERKAKACRADAPDEPWKWEPAWADGRIACNTTSGAVALWLFALFWNLISSPLLFAIPEEVGKGNYGILVGLIFPVVGVGLLAAALYGSMQRRKYGTSVFQMDHVPGVVDGTVEGTIHVPAQIQAEGGMKVRLACVRRVTSGSGKNRSTHESVVWDQEKVLVRETLPNDPMRTGIPVYFRVPAGLPDPVAGNPAVLWRLSASAETPGVDYSADFEIPVYTTAESGTMAETEDPTLDFQQREEDYVPPIIRAVRFERTSGGLRMASPPFANPGTTVGIGVFALIWWGSVWFMIVQKAPILFPLVFGLFGILMIGFLLDSIFRSRQLTIHGERIVFRSNFLFWSKTRTWMAGDIEDIRVARANKKQSSNAAFQIELVSAGTSTVCTAIVRDRQHADWLAKQILDELTRASEGLF